MFGMELYSLPNLVIHTGKEELVELCRVSHRDFGISLHFRFTRFIVVTQIYSILGNSMQFSSEFRNASVSSVRNSDKKLRVIGDL